MPRIRSLKPDFWTDEKMSVLDPLTRLVYLALISLADDAGRLIDNVKLLDGQIFPNTDETCAEALDTLARLERIQRYRSANGQQVLWIIRWADHQKVDKPSKRVLPGPETAVVTQPVVSRPPIPPEQPPSIDSRATVAGPSEKPRETPATDLGPRTLDQGPRSVEQDRATSPLRAIVAKQAGEHWPDLERFIASRAAHTHDAWLGEFSKLTGPGSQFTWADLARATSDALLLDEPLTGPHALRAFIGKAREARVANLPKHLPTTSSPTEVVSIEDRRRARLEEEYGAARAAAVATWATTHGAEYEAMAREVKARIPVAGAFGDLTRKVALEQQAASSGAFPSFDQWLAERQHAPPQQSPPANAGAQ